MKMQNINKISIIGSGNVGRRIGEYFSKKMSTVVVFNDINQNVVKELGKMGYNATTDMDYTLKSSDISFVAVPTPIADDGLYNTSFLENVFISIGKTLKNKKDYHIFVLKSTVTPGTTEELIIPIIEKYSGKKEGTEFGMAYNPEFLTVIQNTWTDNKEFCISSNNEGRIVLGEGNNKKAGDIIEKFYNELNPNIPILRTDYKTSEMTKLVTNSRLALAISYSNHIFLACEEMKMKGIDINVNFIIDSISRDSRIGKYGSTYGKAWGGPCFLKDTAVLMNYIKNKTGNFPRLIKDSIEINNEMKDKFGIRE
jgi:UDPglucose 6-dehydrogenase